MVVGGGLMPGNALIVPEPEPEGVGDGLGLFGNA
jgi:hypothetical protein